MKTTYLIIVLNVAVFALMLGIGGAGELHGFSSLTLMQVGANYGPATAGLHEWWRLFTSVFMHISPVHLGMNMALLYLVGLTLEGHFGRARFLLVYLLAGLGGALASLAGHWANPVASAGASGSISGLIGAGAVVGQLMGGAQGIAFRNRMLIWAGLVMVFGVVANVDNQAHAGGLVVGIVVAFALDAGGRGARRPNRAQPFGWESLLLVALVGASFALAGRTWKRERQLTDAINDGIELLKADKQPEARLAYERALAIDPRNHAARYDLALSYLRDDHWPEAATEAQRAIDIDPKFKDAWWVLGQALERQGKSIDATLALARYLALGADGGVPAGGGAPSDGGTPSDGG